MEKTDYIKHLKLGPGVFQILTHHTVQHSIKVFLNVFSTNIKSWELQQHTTPPVCQAAVLRLWALVEICFILKSSHLFPGSDRVSLEQIVSTKISQLIYKISDRPVVSLLIPNFSCADFFLPNSYIFMAYVAEQPELPVGPFSMDERLERTIQFLDGHLLLGLLVNGRTNWK